ncbi:MAG: helix-turn-helix transcriptional regulator [Eubacterium sp.]|nr:helix-turn-helix transcriptional regulator [Eubacterium sp.]
MKIYFGENLKRLRKDKGLTQEALAYSIGVSFQTISKWERDETYPDITVLPVIAAIFEVTVDNLLGADKPQKEKEAEDYIELYNKMHLKNVSEVLKEYKNAIKRFPDDYAILVRYMELLRLENFHQLSDYESITHELTSAYFKIQGRCNDESIRIWSKRIMVEHLMFQYCCLGYDEEYRKQAKLIVDTLPSLSDSKEIVSIQTSASEDWNVILENTIEELSFQLQRAIISYCHYDDSFSNEYKIKTIESINDILKLIDTNNNITKNRIHIIYNYGHLGSIYATTNDIENALKNLRLAAELAKETDNNPQTEKIKVFYEQEHRFRNMNMKERMYELMTKHYNLSEKFKATPEFQEIISILK